jgi:serine/threonine protein kinase
MNSGNSGRPATSSRSNKEEIEALPYGAVDDMKKVQDSFNRTSLKEAGHSSENSEKATSAYTAERVLGSGSFGVVYQATAVETGETVAIKKVLQDKRYKNRELEIIQELRHPNVVELFHAFFTSEDKTGETYLNLVMEYCTDTLHRVVRHYSKLRRPVPDHLVQLYSYQMCRGCAYIHAVGVCHRDIKPQNILVDARTDALKLCDFGSAKRLQKGESSVAYISSRYYRAPELIFGATRYGMEIDIWSTACVAAEVMLGQPLFVGKNNVSQLVEIIKVLGTPTREQVYAMNPNYQEFQFRSIKSQSLRKMFRPSTSQEAIDFLAALLVYVPDQRPTGLQSCAHVFFDSLRAAGGAARRYPSNMFDFSKEEASQMDDELRARLAPATGREA